MGHVCRNCPDCVPAGAKESKGTSSGHSHVAPIVYAGMHVEDSMNTVAVEVDPVDKAIGSIIGTMHGVSGGEGQQCLGSTIWTEITFEGSPMEALVDTNSPATIDGLQFVLEVLAAQWDHGQSSPEWASYEPSRMQQPTTTRQNYGGGKLNIVRQMPAKLSKGDKQLQTVVNIRPGWSTSRPAVRH